MNDKMTIGAFALAASTLVGCEKNVGEAVRPDAPTAAAARGEDAAVFSCTEVAPVAEPLVVDWAGHDRMDLAIALRDEGVAVVSYTCDGLKLLKHCALRGDYRFAGSQMLLDVVELESADSIAASLPVQGAAFSASVSGESKIDVATAIVGRVNTLVRSPTTADLDGECDGATHYVRSAYVGAFSVATGSKGSASVAADVFQASAAASSSSSRASLSRDGDLSACEAYDPNDADPPSSCRSAVRVELSPLASGTTPPPQKEETEVALANTCSAGYVVANGKCSRPAAVAAYRCDREDYEDCKKQCAAGDADSCYHAGLGPVGRAPVAPNSPDYPKRRAEARPYMEKACDGGIGLACNSLAIDYGSKNSGVFDIDKSNAYLQQACFDNLLGTSCIFMSSRAAKGEGVKKDAKRAVSLMQRGCNLGSVSACTTLGKWFIEGEKSVALRPDPAKGTEILDAACTQAKLGYACFALAAYHQEGKRLKKDKKEAKRLKAEGCRHAPTARECKA